MDPHCRWIPSELNASDDGTRAEEEGKLNLFLDAIVRSMEAHRGPGRPRVELGDVDNDGDLDIVFGSNSHQSKKEWKNEDGMNGCASTSTRALRARTRNTWASTTTRTPALRLARRGVGARHLHRDIVRANGRRVPHLGTRS